MPLTIGWNGGVTIRYGSNKLVFDPRRKKQLPSKIFITHGHYDHSKGFSFKGFDKFSTEETRNIVAAYGRKIEGWKPLPVEGKIEIEDLEIVSHNAGHVLGSNLFEVITPEGNVVYTGDLQFQDSFTLKGAQPVSCDVLIIDSTFGSKGFKFPDRETVAWEMIEWARRTIRKGKMPTFRTDSLGNAQEVTKAFNLYSDLTVRAHGRVAQINNIYASNGHHLEFLDAGSEEALEVSSSNDSILVTPKKAALNNSSELETALVSGWALWTKKTAFALSDHADFYQLMDFVRACEPRAVLTCFGGQRNYIFAKEVEKEIGIEARPLNLITTKFVL